MFNYLEPWGINNGLSVHVLFIGEILYTVIGAYSTLEVKCPMRSLLRSVLAVATLAASANAYAGVTIHYEGRAPDAAAVERVLAAASEEAKRNGWQIRDDSSSDISMKRVVDERDVPYRGPVRGIVLQPSPECEPIHLQFDSNMFMQDFVKTQFAGPEIHMQVARLLKVIQPLLRSLKVEDEGEYWETESKSTLEGHMAKVNTLMAEMKRSKPDIKGPVTLPSGRIVDLMR